MLFFFVQTCFSKWWDMNVSELDSKLSNSNKEPIFMFVFSATCPHCRGVPEQFREFGREMESSKIIMTSLNCTQDRNTCARTGVRGFPSWFYITDANPTRWEWVGYRDPRDWKKYIESKGKETKFNKNEAIKKTEKGKAVFHIVAAERPENLVTLKEDLKRSDSELIFQAGTEAKMTVLLGPKCEIKATNESLDEFVQKHRFGHFHKYSFDDWNLMSQSSTLAVFFVQKKMTKEEKEILAELSSEFCGSMTLGWAPIGHSFKIMKKMISGDQSKPFIGATKGSCHYLLRDNITLDSARAFLQQVADGSAKCIKDLTTKSEVTNAKEEISVVTRSHNDKIVYISVAVCAIAIACVGIILNRKLRAARKNE